jgi:hypothetical protein
MAARRPKRPTDANQLGKLIVDLSVGETSEEGSPDTPASAFARLGGIKGGHPWRRRAQADRQEKAADARWARKRESD